MEGEKIETMRSGRSEAQERSVRGMGVEKTTKRMIEGSTDERSESSHVFVIELISLSGCAEKAIIIIHIND